MFEATVIAIGLVGAAGLAFGFAALRQTDGSGRIHDDRGEDAGDSGCDGGD